MSATFDGCGFRAAAEDGWILLVAVVLLAAVLAVAVALAGGRAAPNPVPDVASKTIPEIPGHFRIFFTADTRGYLEPCGCVEGQFGGVARRATYLRATRRPGDLLLDLGNINLGQRPHDRLRLTYVLRALAELRYDALVPGEGELSLEEEFERAARRSTPPLAICANLRYSDSKEPVFPPYRTHELPDGRKLAVVGLTSPYQQIPGRYEVSDPAAAAAEVLAELEGRVDAVILAGWLDGQLAVDLAARFPAVRVVAGGRVPKGSQDLLRRGGPPVMLGGERAQYVSWVSFDERLAATTGGHAWLGGDVLGDANLAALVSDHDRETSTLGAAFAADLIAGFRSEGRLGSTGCAECHADEYAIWAASKHAHAMATLRAKGQERNPNCLRCHLQDLGAVGESTLADGVGCEACHGGARTHARSHTLHDGAETPARLPRQRAIESCVLCHDEANSPHFDARRFWERVRHGPSKNEVR